MTHSEVKSKGENPRTVLGVTIAALLALSLGATALFTQSCGSPNPAKDPGTPPTSPPTQQPVHPVT